MQTNFLKNFYIYTENFHSDATKYGIGTEPQAKTRYMAVAKRFHKGLKSNDCGLSILKDYPVIAASPDMEITCNCICCEGGGLVEIKCPYSMRGDAPDEQLGYLKRHKDSKALYLNRSHIYYTQIQGQMGVTGKKYCDFFVYTPHGHHLERIEFDSQFWEKTLKNLNYILVQPFGS